MTDKSDEHRSRSPTKSSSRHQDHRGRSRSRSRSPNSRASRRQNRWDDAPTQRREDKFSGNTLPLPPVGELPSDKDLERAAVALLTNEIDKSSNNNNKSSNNGPSKLPGAAVKIWRPEQGEGARIAQTIDVPGVFGDISRLDKRHNHNHSNRHTSSKTSSGANSIPLGLDSISDADMDWGKAKPRRDADNNNNDNDDGDGEKKSKKLPDFKPSGKLVQEALQKNGVTLKYAEPGNTAMPKQSWRLYVFKGDEHIDTIHIHRQSCYRIGREARVCELILQHLSCSSQHAVLQFRRIERKNAFDDEGRPKTEVVPSIIDLKSTNGTYLNGKKIQDSIFIELREKDVLKFGDSTREYVLLHDKSAGGDSGAKKDDGDDDERKINASP